MNSTLLWVVGLGGFALVCISTLMLWANQIKEQNNNRWCYSFIMIGVGLAATFLVLARERDVLERMASEVDMGRVPVLGERKFYARVEITYVDGKLKSVVLVSSSTVPQ